MTTEDYQRALEIITSSTQVKVAFNVPVKDNYGNKYKILILESNASILKMLHDENYSLSMTKKGLSINKHK